MLSLTFEQETSLRRSNCVSDERISIAMLSWISFTLSTRFSEKKEDGTQPETLSIAEYDIEFQLDKYRWMMVLADGTTQTIETFTTDGMMSEGDVYVTHTINGIPYQDNGEVMYFDGIVDLSYHTITKIIKEPITF